MDGASDALATQLVAPEVVCPSAKLTAAGVAMGDDQSQSGVKSKSLGVTVLPAVTSDAVAAYEASKQTYGFQSKRILLRQSVTAQTGVAVPAEQLTAFAGSMDADDALSRAADTGLTVSVSANTINFRVD